MLNLVGRSVACVDPGRSAGLVIWTSRAWKCKNQCPNVQMRVRGPTRERHYHLALDDQLNSLMVLFANYDVGTVFCELPARFEGRRAAAAEASGSILKLMYWVGQLAGMCYSQRIRFYRVPVRLWKGTLTKQHTQKRVSRVASQNGWIHRVKKQPDVIDALGIGLFLQRNKGALDEVCKS